MRDPKTGARGRRFWFNGREVGEIEKSTIQAPDDDELRYEVEFIDPTVIVDRARFERLLAVVDFARKLNNTARGSLPEGIGRNDLERALADVTASDLEPIP